MSYIDSFIIFIFYGLAISLVTVLGRPKTIKDIFFANKTKSWIEIAVSNTISYFSPTNILVYFYVAYYLKGFKQLTLTAVIPIALGLTAIFLTRFLAKQYFVFDIIKQKIGKSALIIIIILFACIRGFTAIYGISLLFKVLGFHFDFTPSVYMILHIIITGFIVYKGGMNGLITLNYFIFTLLILFLTTVCMVGLFELGGYSEFLLQVPLELFESPYPQTTNTDNIYASWYFTHPSWLLVSFIISSFDLTQVNYLISAKDEKTIRKSLLATGISYILIRFSISMIGLILFQALVFNGIELKEVSGELSGSAVQFLVELVPVGIKGICIAALLFLSIAELSTVILGISSAIIPLYNRKEYQELSNSSQIELNQFTKIIYVILVTLLVFSILILLSDKISLEFLVNIGRSFDAPIITIIILFGLKDRLYHRFNIIWFYIIIALTYFINQIITISPGYVKILITVPSTFLTYYLFNKIVEWNFDKNINRIYLEKKSKYGGWFYKPKVTKYELTLFVIVILYCFLLNFSDTFFLKTIEFN